MSEKLSEYLRGQSLPLGTEPGPNEAIVDISDVEDLEQQRDAALAENQRLTEELAEARAALAYANRELSMIRAVSKDDQYRIVDEIRARIGRALSAGHCQPEP